MHDEYDSENKDETQAGSELSGGLGAWTDADKRAMREAYNDGDWVFGIGPHLGCSEVFEGYGHLQPFSYLNDYDPTHFRLATPEEIAESLSHMM